MILFIKTANRISSLAVFIIEIPIIYKCYLFIFHLLLSKTIPTYTALLNQIVPMLRINLLDTIIIFVIHYI